MNNFEDYLEKLDIKVFEPIESQLEVGDKHSLLACQSALRQIKSSYTYLEIGSYLGGSIQPHLLDERCAKIFSIDKRPASQPDERGVDYMYLNNSTERMIEKLRNVSSEGITKLTTIDGDTSEIRADEIKEKVDLCFIDGEHTDRAAFRDFKFCLDVLAQNGVIIFHDAPTTYHGLAESIQFLKEKGIKYRAYNLPSIVFVVEIGEVEIHRHPAILEKLTNNHESYIYSLQYNDHYRQFANKWPFKLYRRMMVKLKGLNKFE